MTPAQLNERYREELVKQLSVGHQIDATVKLYEAAAMMNNKVLMEQYREQLHNLVDVKLDTTNSLMELTRQMVRSQ